MNDPRSIPEKQVLMLRPHLNNLPTIELPKGYTLRTFWEGDESAWDRITGEAFEVPEKEGYFERRMCSDEEYRPDRIFFICKDGEPVATASAWYRAQYGEDTGYLHMVAVLASERGKGLGYQASLACLHKMVEEKRTAAVLLTETFRVPAIKAYLRLGFEPHILLEEHKERWRNVFIHINRPELIEKFADIITP